MRHLFELRQEPPRPNDEIVTAFRDGQVTFRRNRREEGFTHATQEHGYQRVYAGDLVIHAMDAFAGAIGVSDSTGTCSPVCQVLVPRSNVDPRFMAYALRHAASASARQTVGGRPDGM
jgi:type I restriction enzyme, S subunit